MLDSLDRIANVLGETATDVLIIFLLVLAVASEVWEWIIWLKLRPEPAPLQMRRRIEITSLIAGTSSMMLFALFLTGMVGWFAGGKEWAVDLWIFGGAGVCWIALVASGLCRGRVRIAGVMAGVLMGWFWWGLWDAVQFARGFELS